MPDELPETSCVSPTMKDLEHNATPVISNSSVFRSPMSVRDCLSGGVEPQGFCASRAGYGARGETCTAEVRGPGRRYGQKPVRTRVSTRECMSTRAHEHPTCRDALSNRRRRDDASEQVDHLFNHRCPYGWHELGDWAGSHRL